MLRQIEAMLPSVVPSKRGSAVPSTPRETFGVNQAAYDTLCKKIQVEFTRLRALSQDCMSIGAHQKIVNIESALDRLETHLRTHLRENINEETMLDYCRVGGISLAQRLAEPRYCSFFTCISKADDALTGVRQLSANETKPLLQ